MQELLKSEDFHHKVAEYIWANLHAHLPGLDSVEAIKSIPNEVKITYLHPPHPDLVTYDDDLKKFELWVACAKQVHTCKFCCCLFWNKKGQVQCKRRAPFEWSQVDMVTESGHWTSKHVYEFMNGWVPALILNVWCNNDGKLLTNGGDTYNITFYVSFYAAKKQGKNFNTSAVMVKGYAYHTNHSEYIDNLHDKQWLLIFHLVHTINHKQELAAVMVILYLMGWGDVYWSLFVGVLLKAFPELWKITKLVT